MYPVAACRGQSGAVSAVAAPTAPTNLVATGGALQVGFTWTAVSGATSYSLFQGTTPGGESGTPVATGLTGTAYTLNTGLASGTRYYFTLKAVNSGGTSTASNEANAYTNSSLLTGLAAYYAYETLTTDSSGNNNTTTNNGSIVQGAGILNQGAVMALASSRFFSLADNPTIDFTTKMSISIWVKTTSLATNQAVIGKGDLSSNLEWLFRITTGTGVATFFIGNVSLAIFGSSTASITINVWHHVVIVYDGTQTGNAARLLIWVDGVQQTVSFTGTIPATNTVGAGSLFIGKLGGASPIYLNGTVDETGLWNVPLTSGQVASLYNSGAAVAYPFTGVS